MTTSNKYDSIEKLIFDEGLRMESLQINSKDDTMFVHLNNGHMFVVRLSFYLKLKKASPESLSHFNFISDGTGIHWPELDEDLSLKGLLKDFLIQRLKTEMEMNIG